MGLLKKQLTTLSQTGALSPDLFEARQQATQQQPQRTRRPPLPTTTPRTLTPRRSHHDSLPRRAFATPCATLVHALPMQELHELRRSAWLSRDMQEGVSAFFQKRVPDFQGS